MKIFYITLKYLKNYRFLSIAALFSIIASSTLEGASFGMLIPLIQSMTNFKINSLAQVPFMKGLSAYLSSIEQAKLLPMILLLMLFIVIVKNAFLYFSNILIAKLTHTVTRDSTTKLMNNVIEYDLKYFDNIKSGYIISNATTETARMGTFIFSVLSFTAILARITAYIALLFLISWKASIVVFAFIACVFIPIEIVMKKMEKLGGQLSLAFVDKNFKLTEIISGIRVIKACSTEEVEKRGFKSTVDRIYDLRYKINKCSGLLTPVSEVVMFALLVLCFFIMTSLIKINIANAFPFIATYLLVLVRSLTMLSLLNNLRSSAVSDLAAFDSYEKLYDKNGKKTIESGARPINNFSDSVELKDVSFSYADNKYVLENVTIKIPKGKITAIVGASGSGKTTLVNLIMRFYDINKGYAVIDGINLRDVNLREWRKKIGFVSQDIFIFNMSVKDNISYGHSGIYTEKIIEAAKAANAHDFIMSLPNKYDTVLGERGVRLSGGQKQRISIARAIIHNPEILVLDEATSSLDTKTEKLIKEAIDRLTKNRTVIAIAHRLSTIVHADNIIVLDKGRIVEGGAHSELMKNNGLYKRFYDSQSNVPSAK